MKNELVKKIIQEKIPCYFVSPHFDDAILSAGDMLTYLSKYTKVSVINVFTKGGKHNTLSAKRFLRLSGNYKNANTLFTDRDKEEQSVFAKLFVKRINLNFTDALWRRSKNSGFKKILGDFIPEISSIYPTYRFHVLTDKIAKEDMGLVKDIQTKLRTEISDKKSIIYCPQGIGRHVDHLVVREACEREFENVCLWQDVPYYQRMRFPKIKDQGKKSFVFQNNPDLKEKLISLYKTQVKGLFPKGKIKLLPEVYTHMKGRKYNIYEVTNPDHHFYKKWDRLWVNALNSHIYNSPQWYKACQKTFNYKKCSIFVIEESGEIKAILPLVKEKIYKISSWTSPGEDYLDKNTILLMDTNPIYLKKLIRAISKNDNLYIPELFYSQARNLMSSSETWKVMSSVSPYLPLYPNPFAYTPKWVIGKIENTINTLKTDLKYKTYFGLNSKLLSDIEIIDSKSIKTKRGLKVFTNSSGKSLFINLSKISPQSVFVGILYLSKVPISYKVGFVKKGTYYASQTAYDIDYAKLGPGKILAYLAIEDFAKRKYELFDFTRGLNFAKGDFTPFRSTQYDIFVSENWFTLKWWKLVKNLEEKSKNNKVFYSAYCYVRKVLSN